MIGTTQGLVGEFRKISLSESVVVLAGDTAVVSGDQLIISRAGQVVAVRLLDGNPVIVPLGAEQTEVLNSVLYFWRKPVSGVVATLVDVSKNTTTGSITFAFSDGNSIEYASGAQAIQETDYIDTDNAVAKQILVRKTMINSPDETNLTTMLGATCTIDCNATQPMSVRVD